MLLNTCLAQKTQKPQFGLKGGMNISNLSSSGDGSPIMKSKINYNLGGFIEIKIGEKLFLQPELIFSKQGADFDYPIFINGINYDTKNTFNLYYLNFSTNIKYQASNNFSFEIGPQVSLLTSSNLVVSVLNKSNTQDVEKLFKDNDFGINIGANYNFNKNLFANVRYCVGLSNIAVTEEGDNTVLKNNVISINLGVKFN